MADNDRSKQTGTIFMGNRETSVEQLHAMQEPLRREQIRRVQAEDYMERVRKKAADRAREILGAAYMEKQNVLDEAKKEILAMKKKALEECERLKAEGEEARAAAQAELDKAVAIREEAENIREAAHDEGYGEGMEKATEETRELRSEMGQSLALVLNALGRQRKEIMNAWSEDIAEVVRCAVRSGTGMILREEREAALRALVFRALDSLERQEIVTLRVNPGDEDMVGQMFQAAREKYPTLKQWIVSGDSSVEPGGLVAESGSGSVDLRRSNFEEMVENVLNHLYLPEDETKNQNEIRDLVEQEVAKIAGLTPEPEPTAQPEPVIEEEIAVAEETPEEQEESVETEYDEPRLEDSGGEEATGAPEYEPDGGEILNDLEMEALEDELEPAPDMEEEAPVQERPATDPGQPSYEELDEEFFPLDDLGDGTGAGEAPSEESAPTDAKAATPPTPPKPKDIEPPDPTVLAEGGFL